jgi:hypothetical protein
VVATVAAAVEATMMTTTIMMPVVMVMMHVTSAEDHRIDLRARRPPRPTTPLATPA